MVAPIGAAWVVPNLYQPGPDPVLGGRGAPAYVRSMSTMTDPMTADDLLARATELGPELAARAAGHDRDGSFVDEGRAPPPGGRPARAGRSGRAGRRRRDHPADGRRPARARPPLRLDRAGQLDAPARHLLHRVALPPRPPRRGGHPAPHRGRGHPARVDRRRRLHPPARRGDQGRRRLPGLRSQDLRQPVARRHRDVDDVPLRRPRARVPASSTWRCPFGGGRHRPRQLGHPGHAGHGEPRRRHRGRLRARRAGAGQPSVRRHRPARCR